MLLGLGAVSFGRVALSRAVVLRVPAAHGLVAPAVPLAAELLQAARPAETLTNPEAILTHPV